jgi:DNA-binding HxlR family transcriptional regulator
MAHAAVLAMVALKELFVGREEEMDERSDPSSKGASTIFIGKWTVEILSCLQKGTHRHGELLRQLDGVSQHILTRTLRNLESAGLVARRVTRSKSIAVEYSLTSMGETLMAPLTSICGWAERHHKKLSATLHLLKINAKR